MHPSPSWLAWWLVAASGARDPDTGAPAASAPAIAEFTAARVEVIGFDEAAVLAALRLRLARLELAPHGGPPPTTTPHVYVQIRRDAGDAGRVHAITSDGRAYERSFTIEVGQEVRVAASTAASLVFSIEQGAVAPVEEDVEIPGTPEPTPPEPATGPEPALAEPEPTPPKPSPRPTPAATTPAAPRPPAWELMSGLHGVAVLGLGAPRHGDALAGAGGGLTVAVRSPRGGLVALDVRGLGRGTDAFAAGRVRIGLAGGYALRRGRFELPVLLGVTVEPWWAAQAGARAPIYSGSTVATAAPLIGGVLQVTPALRLAVARGPLAAVRVGPRLELAASYAVADGARVVGLVDADGAASLRLGGVELALALELALQWSLARRR